jgi:hypothetical protein
VQAVANVNDFILTAREFTTRMGGLFLFIPDLVQLESDALAEAAKLPGSRMIPAAHALRASLALKLWAIERKIAHFLGNQAVAEAELSPPHLNHAASPASLMRSAPDAADHD